MEKSDKTTLFIPYELQLMYETALLTLAGSEKIPQEFCGEEVFKKIRQKFNNAIGHTKAKKVVDDPPQISSTPKATKGKGKGKNSVSSGAAGPPPPPAGKKKK